VFGGRGGKSRFGSAPTEWEGCDDQGEGKGQVDLATVVQEQQVQRFSRKLIYVKRKGRDCQYCGESMTTRSIE